VLYAKPVEKPVPLEDSKMVVASVELDAYAEVYDFNEVLSVSNVVTYCWPVERKV